MAVIKHGHAQEGSVREGDPSQSEGLGVAPQKCLAKI